MLGIQPVIGRLFLPDEGKAAENHVALLNESLWRNRFGADRYIVGKTISLDGTGYTVVGVMPAGIRYPRADVWRNTRKSSRPLGSQMDDCNGHRPSEAWDQPSPVEPAGVDRKDGRAIPARARGCPLSGERAGGRRPHCLRGRGKSVAFAGGCARQGDRGPRHPRRGTLLVQQLLTESLLLGICGGLVGLVAGLLGMRLLRQLIPPDLPSSMTLEWRTFGFVAALAILATALFGLVPAFIVSICEVNESLKDGRVVKL
jgi:putative ABC transport system permease protein